MGKWVKESKSHVAHMDEGDFYGSEKSVEISGDANVKIEFSDANGNTTVLKEKTALIDGEIIENPAFGIIDPREPRSNFN